MQLSKWIRVLTLKEKKYTSKPELRVEHNRHIICLLKMVLKSIDEWSKNRKLSYIKLCFFFLLNTRNLKFPQMQHFLR